jgi:hypothetical protein|tara:strand:- start:946 stop:1215 length:270 start_codon:yes stop_codon:yes gene_type:complete
MAISTHQYTLSTTRQALVKGNNYRRSITILNEDSSINVLLCSNGTDDGMIILPLTSITLDPQGSNDPRLPLQFEAASGSPQIRIMEDYI